MAFDSSTSPLLTTTSVSGDPSIGLEASENLIAQAQYGLQVLDGGAGGQFEVRSAGNLLSLAQLSTAGLIAIAVPGVPSSMVTVVLQGNNSIAVDDSGAPGGIVNVSVVPSTTLQFHQTQVNGVDIGTPYDTVNFVNSSTASFVGSDGGTKANVTVNVEGTLAPADGPFVITQADADLTGATNLGILSTGLVYSTSAGSVSTLSTTTAPTMSGANITAGTIPVASVAGTAVNLSSVQTISGAKTFTSNVTVPTLSVVSGTINMNAHKIENLLDPTNPQDAATKNYVDTLINGANFPISFSGITPAPEPVALATIAVPPSTTITITGQFASRGAGTPESSGGWFFAVAENTGSVVLLGTPLIISGTSVYGDQTLDIVGSGTNLIIQATGSTISSNLVDWNGFYIKTLK